MLIKAIKANKVNSEKGDIHANGAEVLILGEALDSNMYFFGENGKFILAIKEKFKLLPEIKEIEIPDDIIQGIKASPFEIEFYEKK